MILLFELKIKEHRLRHNMTQAEVAERLCIAQSQYSRLEKGISVINLEQLIKLCNLFDCTLNDLVVSK